MSNRSRFLQRLSQCHVAAPDDGRTPSESVFTLRCIFRQALRKLFLRNDRCLHFRLNPLVVFLNQINEALHSVRFRDVELDRRLADVECFLTPPPFGVPASAGQSLGSEFRVYAAWHARRPNRLKAELRTSRNSEPFG